MTGITSLDSSELMSWLDRETQTIDRSLREAVRSEAFSMLQLGIEKQVALNVLTQLALLDDCLRVGHLAIEADGKIDAAELERVADLVTLAAARYSAALPVYARFSSNADVAAFLRFHRHDSGSFGFESQRPWSGLNLVRHVEKYTRNASPLRDHERMLARVMDHVFAGRETDVERDARRRLRAMFERQTVVGLDPRALAFCRPDGPEVFASVAHGSHFHEHDPYDVESIHAEIREVFHRQVERATTPDNHQYGHGRTLLILGESGAGKTHLLRALRTKVHKSRIGYVGYLQMTSEVNDYPRYVLRSLIDSMERPYDAPTASESALMYLSDGLIEGRVQIPPEDIEKLRTAEMGESELASVVGGLVDNVLRTEGLETLETDVVHALLLLQRRDPALQRRVVKYLRCETLNTHDRKLLGGLSSRDQSDDPLRTIRQLAHIQYELQMAALVIVVDQIEETIPDGHTVTRLQQAFDSLRAIADAIPSAVVVVSCLDDVYTVVRPKLSQSLVDRLENDPGPLRLTSQRQIDEVEQMLITRLEHLYSELGVPWREDDPIYPFTATQIEAVSKFRARDCLAKFREYHNACIAAGDLVSLPEIARTKTVDVPGADKEANLARAWNDARTSQLSLPDTDEGVLALVERALRMAASDSKLELRCEPRLAKLELALEGATLGKRLIALCNRSAQGGHLGKQFEGLKKLAETGTKPFALRNSDFQFKPKTVVAAQVGELIKAGGRTVVLSETDLRSVLAFEQLAAKGLAGFAVWRELTRPLDSVSFVRAILDVEQSAPKSAPVAKQAALFPQQTTTTAAPSMKRISAPIAIVDPAQIRIGVSTSLRAEPHYLGLEQVKSHVTFIGGTGSGKTTAALNVVEQLLERGVSALLLDRKGDLARYASEAWWRDPTAPDADRRIALRTQIDVELYTPGNSAGRPLRLPLIPSLVDLTSNQERAQVAQFAANGLGAMMGYGSSSIQRNRLSVLQVAISLHTDERDVTLDVLQDTIDRPDPELLQKVGSLERHFATLSEDLQSLRIQRGALLAGDGPVLDVANLLPPQGSKPKLSIINTSALSDVALLQFWVSRLLIELSRLARKRPTKTLQGVAFFDEADAYVPAIGTPPTKEPMFDLLRRARSGGLGVLLATQNPGDFDYKARDNIATWLVGKVSQARAIEKMRNLIGAYPNVGPRLANQPTGHFFALANTRASEVRSDRSMMQTEQLSESEVLELTRSAI